IVINDAVAPKDKLLCKSQVSTPVNDEINFRISFDESDDEDYTILFDKNSFSYKIIFVNDLKMDSENDSIPSPEPAISCFDDLDFFTDFENEFPAIVYNDAQMSKSDLLTELILNPQHIDEFDLNDKTSLSEYDEEEQNVLYFNDLFPFNIICPDNLKSKKDNDDSKIDIIVSFEDNKYTHGSTTNRNLDTLRKRNDVLSYYEFVCTVWRSVRPKRYYRDGVCAIMLRRPRSIRHMALLPREQRRRFLRYEGLEYLDTDIVDFEGRLARIHRREAGVSSVHSVGLEEDVDIRALVLVLILDFFWYEEMQTAGFGVYWAKSARHIPNKGDLRDYWMGISSVGDFLGTAPYYTLIRDPILRLCHWLIACSIAGRSQALKKVIVTDLFYLRGMDVGSINVLYLLTRYLRLFAAGRKRWAHISGWQFVARFVEHFGLLTAKILGELTVIAPELLVIDMAELVRLQICDELDDTWAWVTIGQKRQPVAAAGAPAVAKDAPIIDEGGQADPEPKQAPQQPPPPPPAHAKTMP
ncbi:hypothetical protein Tco_0927392, partial [Tanacetum coccineum]